jgi:protein-S-isoprenylcysteine O-methyltransferase Ste14
MSVFWDALFFCCHAYFGAVALWYLVALLSDGRIARPSPSIAAPVLIFALLQAATTHLPLAYDLAAPGLARVWGFLAGIGG